MEIDTEQFEKEANEIIYALDNISRDPLTNAHEFVELLEGKKSLAEDVGISDMYTINYGVNKRKYNKFCLAYLIKIFINFTSCDDDAEILLVGYKLIDWGNSCNDTVPDIWKNYWEHAHKYNKWFKGKKRGDKANLGRTAENEIKKELSKTLAKIKLNNTGTLGYIDEVLKDFDRIPERLTLPIPEWLKSNEKGINDIDIISLNIKYPKGTEMSISTTISEKTIKMIKDIAEMVVSATPVVVLVVFLGMLGKQIYDHSIDLQKNNDFTTHAPIKENTTNDSRITLMGEDVKFTPLEDDVYGISEN